MGSEKEDYSSGPEDASTGPNIFLPSAIRPQHRPLHDSSVTLEEYMYYAEKTRAEEDAVAATKPPTTFMELIFPSKGTARRIEGFKPNEKEAKENPPAHTDAAASGNKLLITDLEWTNASRALRSASAAACFYLITTDILGPFGVGFSIGTMGWGEGIGLFTLFGICAGFSGYLLWKVFLDVDSYEFPAKNYGDLGFRIWGPWLRYTINFLQALQLMISVGILVISNGLSISQVSKFRLCYIVCCLIWAVVGFFLGQIRTLNKLGFLANFAVVLNLMIMFISMGVMAHSEPNYGAAQAGSAGAALGGASVTPFANGTYPPIERHGGIPPSTNGFTGSINGLMNGVYAYGGAQLFVEFMAELQRPRDFLKAMWGAQFFIYACYMSYGSFVYFYQGQYANQLAYQGLSPYAWQTVCNMLAVLSGIIAATLYGNIGIKVIYNNVFMEVFRAPPITSTGGKILWAVTVPIYWTIAFIIAASIPDFFGLTSVIAAICLVQFTYTFPAFIGLGLFVQKNAMQGEEAFNPVTGTVYRRDSGIKRWIRGFFAKFWYLNAMLLVYTLGSMALSGLGAYAAIKGLMDAFSSPQINAFTCTSPLQG
ncbi:transmembrane amino acid transporter protein domain-containing protein [Trichoderma breve]|uniref:Transmembrane amino acid transporter protein domain-containing protein n=1 Tax=Trichoderma breve TaxID=2034170 RepID=A0A9W9BBH7_9HYPO|nr:transmembrane amino acid transporter protein domain-containing protein [Trichoderma breve]KAJ4856903.1 transmembrane amino acid transporter protein domain-containing protein [Trichoderma breve]